ncbi:uncharacterized protein LOC111066224 [Drosophila obscura]|uniref:uncharacterized protein LOC111066224 n=1 Tax=Drosophila obscura TaxID=7282 RepID=UPI001BB12F89|nr:uncharacterized protein LOC111066224 [Drosophila obscura]
MSPLDNCEVFAQLGDTLKRYDKESKRLNTFVYLSGDDEHISEICNLVNKVLMEHNLVVQRPHDKMKDELVTEPSSSGTETMNGLRGVLALLLLNTTDCLKEDRYNPDCVHLVGQVPPMSTIVALAIALKCGLQQPLNECLAYGQSCLASRLYDYLNENVPKLVSNNFDVLSLFTGFLMSARQAIAYYKHDDASELLDQTANLLQRHLLDSADRLRALLPTPRKRYLALAMNQLLDVLLATLQQPAEKPQYWAIYKFMDYDETCSPKQENAEPLVNRYSTILMDALQRVLQLVTVDTYMSWLELASSQMLYSYQEVICCQSAGVLTLINKNMPELGDHLICGQLKNFAGAAKSLKTRLAELSLRELLRFLDGDRGEITEAQTLAGLEELFQRPICFVSDECVDTMSKHVKFLGYDHIKLIFSHMAEYLAEEAEDDTLSLAEKKQQRSQYNAVVRQVAHLIYIGSSVETKQKILQLRDELGLTTAFPFCNRASNPRRVLFFNRLDSQPDRANLSEFLDICYEDSQMAWQALAELAMSHSRFMDIFWNLACQLAPHAIHYMKSTTAHIFKDDYMITRPNSTDFLLSLYAYPLILNGMKTGLHTPSSRSFSERVNKGLCNYNLNLQPGAMPYSVEQLQAAQSGYLEALATGLAKFTDSNHIHLIECILHNLLNVESADEYIQMNGKEQIEEMTRDKASAASVKVAKTYVKMHAHLIQWRKNSWPVLSQLMKTIDALRWTIPTFDQIRVDVLNLAVSYYKNNSPTILSGDPELIQKMLGQVDTSVQGERWKITNILSTDRDFADKCIILIMQSSAIEATNLFFKAIENKTDCAIMAEISRQIDLCDAPQAKAAYRFFFRNYMYAFMRYIEQSKPAKSDRLADHIRDIVALAPSKCRFEHSAITARMILNMLVAKNVEGLDRMHNVS